MIVLDTNVLSELLKHGPETAVLEWFEAQKRRELAITAINEAELRAGLAAMSDGRRKMALAADISALIEIDLGGRVLPFDRLSALSFGIVSGLRRRAGRQFGGLDGPIAAIAHALGAAVATRDSSGFSACGLTLIDPWTGQVTQPT